MSQRAIAARYKDVILRSQGYCNVVLFVVSFRTSTLNEFAST